MVINILIKIDYLYATNTPQTIVEQNLKKKEKII